MIRPQHQTEEQLAAEVGVSRRTLRDWRLRGCKASTVEDVEAWRRNHVMPRQGGPRPNRVRPDSESDPPSIQGVWQLFAALADAIDELAGGDDQEQLADAIRSQLWALFLRLPGNAHLDPDAKSYSAAKYEAAWRRFNDAIADALTHQRKAAD